MGSVYLWATEADLNDLVAAVKAGGPSHDVALDEIVRRFERKAVSLAATLTQDVHLREDIINAARYAVVKAVRAHTVGTPGLATYIVTTMRGEAHRAMARNVEQREVVISTESTVWTSSRHQVLDTVPADTDLGLLTTGLSTSQRQLVFKRYIIGETMTELARGAATSVSAMSQRFKTVHKALAAAMVGTHLEP